MIRPFPILLLSFLTACASDASSPAPSLPRGDPPAIRVLLRTAGGRRAARIRTTAAYEITDLESGRVLDRGPALDRSVLLEGATLPRPCRIATDGPAILVNRVPYPGALLLLPSPEGVQLVVETDLESYLPGVLAREMNSSFHPAALRAQAVASRTYALHRIEAASTGADWDLTDDHSSQVFAGIPRDEGGILRRAADDTWGTVLVWQGRPLLAYFHSTCGGHTAPAHEVFGGSPVPPLSGVQCDFCSASKYYRPEPTRIPAAEAARALGLGAPLRAARVRRTGVTGRALTLEFAADRTISLPAQDVRARLGHSRLLSTFILDITVEHGALVVQTAGWGHGVGMCQMGAEGLAAGGAGADDILAHYYPGAHLFRLY